MSLPSVALQAVVVLAVVDLLAVALLPTRFRPLALQPGAGAGSRDMGELEAAVGAEGGKSMERMRANLVAFHAAYEQSFVADKADLGALRRHRGRAQRNGLRLLNELPNDVWRERRAAAALLGLQHNMQAGIEE